MKYQRGSVSLLDRYVDPIADAEVNGGSAWRSVATKLDYDGPIAWRIRAGFTLHDAVQMAPCVCDKEFVSWALYLKRTTRAGVCLWIPRLFNPALGLRTSEQLRTLTNFCKEYGVRQQLEFVDAPLLSALALTLWADSGETVPSSKYFSVNTGTILQMEIGRQFRLHFSFEEEGFVLGISLETRSHAFRGCFPFAWAASS